MTENGRAGIDLGDYSAYISQKEANYEKGISLLGNCPGAADDCLRRR
jgi:hypothetical protein